MAARIQSIMSEKLTVEEGEIIGVGSCAYKIARLFKPAPSASREVTEADIERAYRCGHADGRTGGTSETVDDDWRGSRAALLAALPERDRP